MNSFQTTAPSQADRLITQIFEASDEPCLIEVMEDKCFNGKYLNLGTVALYPEPGASTRQQNTTLLQAVRGGSFEWSVPASQIVQQEILTLLGVNDAKPSSEIGRNLDNIRDRVSDTMNSTACVATRLGLKFPYFDASCVGDMPFQRACTVVSDTSGVTQGAFDFII